ncbi:GDSL-type esterase/lipase family protein [Phycisphaeraceae bacterium D3-23]
MKIFAPALVLCSLSALALADVADLRGSLDTHLNDATGDGNTARLIGDTTTLWHSVDSPVDVDLNGFEFTLNTGDGNKQTYTGTFTGPGTLRVVGRSDAAWWPSADIWLGGNTANTMTGVHLVRGSINLGKADGVDALAGPITLGSDDPDHRAVLAWRSDHQVNDNSSITTGASTFALHMLGHSDTFGALAIDGRGDLDLGEGNSQVHFADSSQQAWGAGDTLLIRNWAGADSHTVAFGSDHTGLTQAQVASVGFIDPKGWDPGLYRAAIGADGSLTPDARVEPVDPPFDVSPDARAAREALYNVAGRENLTAADTPLTAGTTLSVFGDSITWQDNYLTLIRTALADGEGTQGLGIRVINRGINGGGVVQVRDGSPDAGFPGNTAQAGFADVIAEDGADIAIVFIGVNDVWWRGTTREAFRTGLQDLADQADAAGVALVFAAPTVHFEKPDGSNGDDAKLDAYTQIMREVADANDAAFVDLRAAYIAYAMNHNAELQLDGSLMFKDSGILTYDGVHPNARGNELLADLISQALVEALSAPAEPNPLGLLDPDSATFTIRPNPPEPASSFALFPRVAGRGF